MRSSVLQQKSPLATCRQPQWAANTLRTASEQRGLRRVSHRKHGQHTAAVEIRGKFQAQPSSCSFSDGSSESDLYCELLTTRAERLLWTGAQGGFIWEDEALQPGCWGVVHQHQTFAWRSCTVLTWPDTRTSSSSWSAPDKAVGDTKWAADSLKVNILNLKKNNIRRYQ